jgi:hypothetical protein
MAFSPWLCDYPRSYCRDCGDVIVWMKTERGRSIPLNLGWVRRVSRGEALGATLYEPSTEVEGLVLVSAGPFDRAGGYRCHIDTCAARRTAGGTPGGSRAGA